MDQASTSVHNLRAAGNARVQVGPTIYHSENRCLEALRTTDPRFDKTRIEEDKGGLLADVYHWVLTNDEFLRWRYSDANRLLWIRGDPGKGKTMLLCGIINEMEKDGTPLSYFFCQAADAINSATAVLRGLLFMLIIQQPSLLSHVQEKYDQAGRQLFEDVNAWVAIRDIFQYILSVRGLQPLCLIVDALDECQTGRRELLDLIIASTAKSHVKWIVSSRNWPDIEEKFMAAEQKVPLSLELNAESVSHAVQLYIQTKSQKLEEEKRYDEQTAAQVAAYLSENAQETFLWVALVCQALEKVHPLKALKVLKSFQPA